MEKFIKTGLFILLGLKLSAQVEYIMTDTLSPYDALHFDTVAIVQPPINNQVDTGLKVIFWIHGLAGNLNSWGHVKSVPKYRH